MTSHFGRSLFVFAVVLALVPGCACSGDAGPADGGVRSDVGLLDAGHPVDAGATDTGAPAIDGGGPGIDGGDPGIDGGDPGIDAGAELDGGAGSDAGDPGEDACVPPPCPAPPPDCMYVGGSFCACGTLVCPSECDGETCSAAQFCDYDTACAGTGMCRSYDPTVVCPPDDQPVCGCDGNTYDNPCSATRMGVDIERAGSCRTSMDECENDDDCAPGERCAGCRGVGGAIFLCLPPDIVC